MCVCVCVCARVCGCGCGCEFELSTHTHRYADVCVHACECMCVCVFSMFEVAETISVMSSVYKLRTACKSLSMIFRRMTLRVSHSSLRETVLANNGRREGPLTRFQKGFAAQEKP